MRKIIFLICAVVFLLVSTSSESEGSELAQSANPNEGGPSSGNVIVAGSPDSSNVENAVDDDDDDDDSTGDNGDD